MGQWKTTRRLAALISGCILLVAGRSGQGSGPGSDRDPPEGEDRPAAFRLTTERYALHRGDSLEAYLRVDCEDDLEMLAWSVEFDPERLEFVDAAIGEGVTPGAAPLFQWFHEGDEDWAQGELVVDGEGDEPEEDRPQIHRGRGGRAVSLRFRVREEAPEGDAEVRFTNPREPRYEGRLSDGERRIYNSVRHRGTSRDPDAPPLSNSTEAEVMTTPLKISILGDVGVFVRGDSNGDDLLDISDTAYLLSYLFLGGPAPASARAADSNLDGLLDIGDAMAVLFELFFQ